MSTSGKTVGVPGLDTGLMSRQVEAAAAEVHRQADHLIQRIAAGEDHERPEHRVLGLEPDLADDETGRADRENRRQVGQVALQVGIFLDVIGWSRQREPGMFGFPGGAPRERSVAVVVTWVARIGK